MNPQRSILLLAILASCASSARAAGLSFVDHRLNEDTGGVWAIGKTPDFPAALTVVTAGGAFWEGGESRLGRTLWQALDADAISGLAVTAMKYTFQRERPSQTSDPNEWFKGPHSQSFPSGDVATTASLVTPLIWEYHDDKPWIYSLAALPLFDMEARMKARGHWQTDVLAGAGVGFLSGYFARKFKNPLILSVMPHGVSVGLRREF